MPTCPLPVFGRLTMIDDFPSATGIDAAGCVLSPRSGRGLRAGAWVTTRPVSCAAKPGTVPSVPVQLRGDLELLEATEPTAVLNAELKARGGIGWRPVLGRSGSSTRSER